MQKIKKKKESKKRIVLTTAQKKQLDLLKKKAKERGLVVCVSCEGNKLQWKGKGGKTIGRSPIEILD